MTHTQKRKIHLGGDIYEWCIRGNSIFVSSGKHITIYKPGSNGTPLHLNPFTWELEIRPSTIKRAIEFAIKNGWEPDAHGQPIKMTYEDGGFKLQRTKNRKLNQRMQGTA